MKHSGVTKDGVTTYHLGYQAAYRELCEENSVSLAQLYGYCGA